jgi:hypothetical protein
VRPGRSRPLHRDRQSEAFSREMDRRPDRIRSSIRQFLDTMADIREESR